MSDEFKIKQVIATKDLTVNIGGITYDALLIPRDKVVEVDYKDCPEDSPVSNNWGLEKETLNGLIDEITRYLEGGCAILEDSRRELKRILFWDDKRI